MDVNVCASLAIKIFSKTYLKNFYIFFHILSVIVTDHVIFFYFQFFFVCVNMVETFCYLHSKGLSLFLFVVSLSFVFNWPRYSDDYLEFES